MKKALTLVVLLFFLMLKSQSYSFDFLTKYTMRNTGAKNHPESAVTYFNSDDFSCFLKVIKVPGKFTGTLYDTKIDVAHRFAIVESKNKGEIFFTFNYEYSFPLKSSLSPKQEGRVEFSESGVSPRQVIMKRYSTKKAKKPSSTHLLTLAPANKNLFPMYSISRTHFVDAIGNTAYPGNYIVTKDFITEGKVSCEFVLEEYKNVDLTITLPKKLEY